MLSLTAALVLLPLASSCTASTFEIRKRDLPTYATPTYIVSLEYSDFIPGASELT